jgi:hypothetical protein
MDNSTFLVLANGRATSVTPTPSGSSSMASPAGMILVPRPSYAAAVNERLATNQQNAVTNAAQNIALKRVPSGGTEIRLVVTNPKDGRPPTSVFAATQAVNTRHGIVTGSLSGGIKVQLTGGAAAASIRTTQSVVSASSVTNTLVRSSAVQLVTHVPAKNTGAVVNGAAWNTVSVVDTNGIKASRESASSSSELYIQIRPEQFKQLVS